MKSVLVLFAHPAFQKSRVNKILVSDLSRMEGVTFHDLYQQYPELDIEVPYEQELLLNHHVIIFHHPFYWYSTPAILKEWQDLVLMHDWAYGSRGNKLKNKLFFNVMTTGGDKAAYTQRGHNTFTIRQLLAPVEKTANLCKMIFLPPFVIHGTHSITRENILMHKNKYEKLLGLFRDEQVDISRVKSLEYLNDYE